MRHLYFLLLLGLFACQNEQSKDLPAQRFATLSGQVNMPGASKVSLSSNNSHRLDAPMQNGQFQLTLDRMQTDHYRLFLGGLQAELYAPAGANMQVDAQPGNVRFSGDFAAENNYLNEKLYMMDTMTADRLLLDLPPNAFAERLKSKKQLLQSHLQQFNGLSSAFQAYAEKILEYQIRQQWQDYIFKNQSQMDAIKAIIGDDLSDYLVKLDQAELIMYPYFHNNLWRNFQQQQQLLGYEGDDERVNAEFRFDMLSKQTAPGSEIRSILSYSVMNQLLNFYRGSKLPTFYETFTDYCQDSVQVQKVTTRYQQLLPLMPGQAAPPFSISSYNGEDVSLSRFDGQYKVINLWATWCKPCIEKFPEWKQIQQQFANEPIAFLTVSIDEKQEQWKSMVEDIQPGEFQLIAGEKNQGSFRDSYMVIRIPRYVIISPDNKIIDADRHHITAEDIQKLLADGTI